MREKTEQPTLTRQSCKICKGLNLRCRVNGTYFCKSCGYDSKIESSEVLKFNGDVPEGFCAVDGYVVPARVVPPHLRPIPKNER